ncbi:FAD-binding oxidoreductase [Arthrobacter sp. BB-1]|uniref:NAD(P)/FAD-dependent oxidoreductase n=1 Tax=unclassified Arthrobacter TaxID=235627 RepID=UPI00111297D6|nr:MULTISPECIES: FAD-binding oxidoreductase [unclassified Arthrobacter]TNB67253.1 FAD-binding oxidoreductase [Arthrobacter sp. BB-1]
MANQVVPLDLSYGNPQPTEAEVVIIGGGIMGVSTAWHLADRGVKNIVVIEQAELGSGSSAKPLGGVRANFSDPGNILLGQRSLSEYARFPEKFGADIGLQTVGYLFLCRSSGEVADLERATNIQNSMGVNSRMVSPAEAAGINPLLDPAALAAASFSPGDGFAEPGLAVAAYAAAARELGVKFLNRTQVVDIHRNGRSIESVVTNRGTIRTGAVVCCAGAWSAGIGSMAGVDLPVTPVRRLIGMTRQQSQPFPRVPFTLDLSTTMYFHNYLNGLLVGISHEQESGFSREFNYDWLPEFNAAASVCAPALENPDLEWGWAGLYENTPDHNALIGQADELPGFFYATGFSGHGFLQGPAVGELVTDLYLGKPTFLDPSHFSATRFQGTETALREVNII